VRHVTFAAAALAAATASLGWAAFSMPAFWLALAGVVLTGILNIAIAFGCALLLAFSARGVPTRRRRLVVRVFLRRLLAAPCYFFRPGVEPEATRFVPSVPVPAAEPGQSSQAGR
jgi:site-specific recombinase